MSNREAEPAVEPAVSSAPSGGVAEPADGSAWVAGRTLDAETLDQIAAEAVAQKLPLEGENGVITQLTKRIIERSLSVEMDEHLGYSKNALNGRGTGNSRNGHYAKTVTTSQGEVSVSVPRDRNGEFEPEIVPKGTRRVEKIDDMILSLYARGLSTRDIEAHLAEVYDAQVSRTLISRVTDVVADEIQQWRNRPLDAAYPILWIDAIMVRVRGEDGAVANRPVYLVTGADLEGYKHILGLWMGPSGDGEGSAFWMDVLSQLRHRGVREVLIVCCDGLRGLPEAIETIWPESVVQTCVVHLIRAAMKFIPYGDRRGFAKALKTVYTANSEPDAKHALDKVKEQYGRKYSAAIAVFERAWDQFTPFLKLPTEVRRIIYTTNAIESINYQLRKITKTRGTFPTEDAAIKLLYLGIRNLNGRHVNGDGHVPAGQIRGTGIWGWKRALNALVATYPGRLTI